MTLIYEHQAQLDKIDNNFFQIKKYIEQAVETQELHEVEKELFHRLLTLGRYMLEHFVMQSGSGYQAGNPPKSEDGKSLEYKGTVESPYISIFGEIQIKRAAYATGSKSGGYFYPIDAQFNLPASKHSYLLQKWMESSSVENDYEQSVEMLNEIFGTRFYGATPQRLAPGIAGCHPVFYEEQEPPDPESEGIHLAVGADGKGIRLRKSEREDSSSTQLVKARRGKGEKPGLKKESIVTVDFSFHPGIRKPEEIVKALMNEYTEKERAQFKQEGQQLRKSGKLPPRLALNKHYHGTLSGKKIAMRYLMERIQKRDPTLQKPIIVLIDGDPYLEDALKKALKINGFSKRVDAMILDIIHVSEYVWDAANALHGEINDQRVSWVREILLSILEGKVSQVIKTLKQTKEEQKLTLSQDIKLRKAITCFENHKHMMDYANYLAKGYPVSTGIIEGACGSLVKDRMEQIPKRRDGQSKALKQFSIYVR